MQVKTLIALAALAIVATSPTATARSSKRAPHKARNAQHSSSSSQQPQRPTADVFALIRRHYSSGYQNYAMTFTDGAYETALANQFKLDNTLGLLSKVDGNSRGAPCASMRPLMQRFRPAEAYDTRQYGPGLYVSKFGIQTGEFGWCATEAGCGGATVPLYSVYKSATTDHALVTESELKTFADNNYENLGLDCYAWPLQPSTASQQQQQQQQQQQRPASDVFALVRRHYSSAYNNYLIAVDEAAYKTALAYQYKLDSTLGLLSKVDGNSRGAPCASMRPLAQRLRPSDEYITSQYSPGLYVSGFAIYTGKLGYCAAEAGCGGATVPIYSLYKSATRDHALVAESDVQAFVNNNFENQGVECYVWPLQPSTAAGQQKQ